MTGQSLSTTEMQLLSLSSNSTGGGPVSPRLSPSVVGPSLVGVGPSLRAPHHPVATTTTTTTNAAAAAAAAADEAEEVLSSSDSNSDWDEWSDTEHTVSVLCLLQICEKCS